MPPLLTPEEVKLEVMSVHAEFQHMMQNDSHRLSHLTQYLCTPDARCDRYFEGSLQSLVMSFSSTNEDATTLDSRDDDSQIREALRDKMLEWWKRCYIPCQSFAVVLSKGVIFTHKGGYLV